MDLDEDEEEESARQVLLNTVFLRLIPDVRADLLKSQSSLLPSSVLLIGEGFTACGFLEAHFLGNDSELIGALFSGSTSSFENSLSQTAPADSSCFLYRRRSHPDIIVCLCKVGVPSAQLHSWSKALFSTLQPQGVEVALLSSTSITTFRSETPTSEQPVPLLRALRTDAFSEMPRAPFLEQPNLCEGLTAAVLSHCHLHRLPAVAYVMFVEAQNHVETSNMRAFRSVMEGAPFRTCLQRAGNTADPERILASIGRQFVETSNIYT